MTLILAVDDDMDALGSIRRVLLDAGYEVAAARYAHEAFEVLEKVQPNLVILDIIMPEMTGIQICERIRANPFWARLPIIFLTAKSRPQDIKAGLEAGGDDYITKPFQIIELPARIKALLRRAPGGILDVDSQYLTIGIMQLHRSEPVVSIDGQSSELTPIQYRLLHYLMIHAGQPQSIDQLLENVWDYPPSTGDPALVYAHVKNLRRKIEPQPDSPVYIRSVRGHGYVVSEYSAVT